MSSNVSDGSVIAQRGSVQSHEPVPQLPRPPSPSTDQGISPRNGVLEQEQGVSVPSTKEVDIYTLSPVMSLKMLCRMVEKLVELTGDVPPTPPVGRAGATSLFTTSKSNGIPTDGDPDSQGKETQPASESASKSQDHDDVPPRAKTPIGSPEARPSEPLHVPDPQTEPIDLQHGIIVRKFYSKRPPSISLEEYLMRVHQYCPMTTGVYLATSLYIHRLAVIERAIPVTARNAHRLVLAGLRVSMKKLEDHRYSHSRFAKVGGVSEAELAKLEVSFCFLTNFDLMANAEMLSAHAKSLSSGAFLSRSMKEFKPVLPIRKDKRSLPLGRPAPVSVHSETPAAA